MAGEEITPYTGRGIAPQSLTEALRMAEIMAQAKLVPTHLRDSPGDCLLVINQALRWGLDPVTVAQATSVVQGKLCYEGKLVAAVLVSTGAIKGRPKYEFSGEGMDRTIKITARTNDGEERTITGRVRDWRSNNRFWDSQPDDMLIYRGIRQWARRYAPEAMLGILTPDEMLEEYNRKSEPPPASGKKPEVVVIQEKAATPDPEAETTLEAEEVHSEVEQSFIDQINDTESLETLGEIRDTLRMMYGNDVPVAVRDAWTSRKTALRAV